MLESRLAVTWPLRRCVRKRRKEEERRWKHAVAHVIPSLPFSFSALLFFLRDRPTVRRRHRQFLLWRRPKLYVERWTESERRQRSFLPSPFVLLSPPPPLSPVRANTATMTLAAFISSGRSTTPLHSSLSLGSFTERCDQSHPHSSPPPYPPVNLRYGPHEPRKRKTAVSHVQAAALLPPLPRGRRKITFFEPPALVFPQVDATGVPAVLLREQMRRAVKAIDASEAAGQVADILLYGQEG